MKIGLNVICTRGYHIYLNQLLEGVRDHFFTGDEVHVFLFTDEERTDLADGITVHQAIVPSYGFPEASMKRFEFFVDSSEWYHGHGIEYLYFIDVDVEVISKIDREALPDESGLVGVHHARMWFADGTWEDNPESSAYVPEDQRDLYYPGGFFGGTLRSFLAMADVLNHAIRADLTKNIMAKWHDESYMNMYFAYAKPKVLPPTYCWPPLQPPELVAAGFTDPKIVCVIKEHGRC